MRRWFAGFLAAAMMAGCAAASEEISIDAKGAVLIDAASGRILFAQNENEMLPEASCTKIMTALLALENSSLEENVTAGKNAHGVPGTSIYLSEGETLTMEQMLYGLMLRSGNDAAVAIAEHIAGTVDDFCKMADERARELDADAVFKNPHGLDADGHRASALGLARIMRKAMENENFRAITAAEKKIIPWVGNEYSRVLQNKNRLLSSYEGANGGKTGYTSKAGRCLVFSARRNDLELIGTVLNCYTWFDSAESMLDWGFENYRMETAFRKGDIVAEAAVPGGKTETVNAIAAETLEGAVSKHSKSEIIIDLEQLNAPIPEGQEIGRVRLVDGDTTVDECALIAETAVPVWNMHSALRSVFRSWVLCPA